MMAASDDGRACSQSHEVGFCRLEYQRGGVSGTTDGSIGWIVRSVRLSIKKTHRSLLTRTSSGGGQVAGPGEDAVAEFANDSVQRQESI